MTKIKCTGLKCPMQVGKVDPATCKIKQWDSELLPSCSTPGRAWEAGRSGRADAGLCKSKMGVFLGWGHIPTAFEECSHHRASGRRQS